MIAELKESIFTAFEGLEFEPDGHVYKLNGRILPSVSKTIKQFVEEFDQIKQARQYATKNGLSASKVLRDWDEKSKKALATGNRVHKYAEGFPQLAIPSDEREAAVLEWFRDHSHLQYIGSEIMVFNEALGVAGTIDLLMFDPEAETIVINDWKTNKILGADEIEYNRLLTPFDDLGDTYLNKYTLQLNLYYILLSFAGFNNCRLQLTHLPPGGGYKTIVLPDIRRRLYDAIKI